MNLTTRIKICGLTRTEDVQCVNEYLPQYAGFVFASSKRQVTPELAAKLVEQLDNRVQSVGVFVNSSLMELVQIAKQVKLDIIQLHGSESPELLQALRCKLPFTPLWKAHQITGFEEQDEFITRFAADAHLVDAYSSSKAGGGGLPFNWASARYLHQTSYPLILAGGLTPQNVGTAVDYFRPFAIDVSSGVETNGVKDPIKIKSLIEVVRSCT